MALFKKKNIDFGNDDEQETSIEDELEISEPRVVYGVVTKKRFTLRIIMSKFLSGVLILGAFLGIFAFFMSIRNNTPLASNTTEEYFVSEYVRKVFTMYDLDNKSYENFVKERAEFLNSYSLFEYKEIMNSETIVSSSVTRIEIASVHVETDTEKVYDLFVTVVSNYKDGSKHTRQLQVELSLYSKDATFLVLQPVSSQVVTLIESPDTDTLGAIKEAYAQETALPGKDIDNQSLEALKQQLTVFFETYNTDPAQAQSLVSKDVILPELQYGAFDVASLKVSAKIDDDGTIYANIQINYVANDRSFIFAQSYTMQIVDKTIIALDS